MSALILTLPSGVQMHPHADWNSALDIIEDANTLLKIDCVRLDSMTENNPLRQKIESEGQVIYTKS